jgi:Holliday junction resolvase
LEKGNNLKRSADLQINHDNMVRYIANDLVTRGYSVRADHINWPIGSFREIDGYIPDITAIDNNTSLIFEIETCLTYNDDHTREKLTAFDKRAGTYIIVPPMYSSHNKNHNPVAEVKQILEKWGLFLVRVGTCDPFTGTINYNP